MTDYDFEKAFARIEDELLRSMMRNMKKHSEWEDAEGFNWSMWQAEQLKALDKYKRENKEKFSKQFARVNRRIKETIEAARKDGNLAQEIEILKALGKGYTPPKTRSGSAKTQAAFFRLNDRKMDSLIKATVQDMEKAETAVLRMANDKYRKIIFDAQVYAGSGAATYEKAVDMATKDFMAAGLNCVEYSNGARHTLSDYAEMAIKTASKRAYLTGEGEKRQEWGISTVIVNKRGNPCPKCLPFVGRIFIDDIWSGGKKSDGPYPLLSSAVVAGLYHPRCKDSHTTYFPGISTGPERKFSIAEIAKIERNYSKEQREKRIAKQAEKYGRMSEFSLDEDNRKMYRMKQQAIIGKGRTMDSGVITMRSGEVQKGYSDVTEIWKENAIPDSQKIIDLQEYIVDGHRYVVDGRKVLLDYSNKEKDIARVLISNFGGEISMVPRVLEPKGVSTPDYIFRGKRFDLKELSGKSKNLIYNAISKKKRQADNFILDISNCPLSEESIYEQVDLIYWSKHTRFVNVLIIVKENKVLKIFSSDKK